MCGWRTGWDASFAIASAFFAAPLPARSTFRHSCSTQRGAVDSSSKSSTSTTPPLRRPAHPPATRDLHPQAHTGTGLCLHNPHPAPPISSRDTGGCALASPGHNARSHSNRPCLICRSCCYHRTAPLPTTPPAARNSVCPSTDSFTHQHHHHHHSPLAVQACLCCCCKTPGAERPFHSLNPTFPLALATLYHHHCLSPC
jgi:hypothetical protein